MVLLYNVASHWSMEGLLRHILGEKNLFFSWLDVAETYNRKVRKPYKQLITLNKQTKDEGEKERGRES